MKKFAFISRHTPTPEQLKLATEAGIELVAVGDRDAFTVRAIEFLADGFEGAVVVHPAAALRLARGGLKVGVFENGTRAEEGGKPTFFAKSLHIFGE